MKHKQHEIYKHELEENNNDITSDTYLISLNTFRTPVSIVVTVMNDWLVYSRRSSSASPSILLP